MQMRKHLSKGSTVALKPRVDVISSPKQLFQWPHKKEQMSSTYLFLPAAKKLGQGNVFTGICDSVHRHPPIPDTPREQTHTPPGVDTPPRSRPPWSRHPPRTRHPPGPDTPPGSRLRHTVNKQPVRILLECNLVKYYLHFRINDV